MASAVETAMAKAQYAKTQPSIPTSTNLIAVTGGGQDASSGMALARSLGVLSGAITTEVNSEENREKKIDTAVVNKVIAGQSAEDMHKLSAVDMLHSYTDFDRSDSKYALVLADKMRGQYLSAESKSKYGELIATDGYAKTPEEEAKRYDEFTQKNFQDYSKNAVDQEAFKDGFYESSLTDRLGIMGSYSKNKSNEILLLAKGTANNTLNGLLQGGATADPATWSSKVQEVFNTTALAGVPLEDRIRMANEFADSNAGLNGRPELLDSIKDIVIGHSMSGEPYTFGMAVNTENVRKKAEIRDSYMHTANIRDTLDKLTNSSTKETAWSTYDALDPSLKREVAGDMDGIIQKIEAKRVQALVQKNKAFVAQNTKETKASLLRSQYIGSINGDKVDSSRNPIAHSMGSLPKFQDYTVDSKGNYTPKEGTFSREDIAGFADNEIAYIRNSNLDIEDKSARVMDLLNVGFMSDYAQTYKMTIGNALARVNSTNTINGQVELNDDTQFAVNMYKKDPVRFRGLFGDDISSAVDTITDLEVTEGSLQGAVNAFGRVRDKLDDKVIKKGFDADATRYIVSQGSSGQTFQDLYGQDKELDLSVAANATLSKMVHTQAVYEMANGVPADEAVGKAMEKIKSSTFVYADTAIPRSLTLGAPPQVTQYVLDDIKQTVKDLGVDEQNVSFEWNPDRQLLMVKGGSYFNTFSKEDLMRRIAEKRNKMQNEAVSNNTTLEEVLKGRENNNGDSVMAGILD